MDRRDFIKISGGALTGVLLGACTKPGGTGEEGPGGRNAGLASFSDYDGVRKDAYFSMMQVTSSSDKIGNSYIFTTGTGRIIVMDGGLPTDESRLRGKLAAVGNHVDAWFISHPHGDHVGALIPILENRKGIRIDKIYHSRLSASLLAQESGARNAYANPFYNLLALQTDTEVIDVQQTGQTYIIDGVKIKVLGIANTDIFNNTYNNSSMVLKVSDAYKSILFLGDAGEENGQKLLDTCRADLDCDYIQMAHHGQQGCDEKFYKTVNFKACLWPTPSWLWKATESSEYKTWQTRKWIEEKGITENHVSCLETDWVLV